MKKATLLILLLTPFLAKAQSRYYLLYDRTKSPVMGAELLSTAHYMFSSVEGQYLKPQLFKEKKWTGKALNIGYRLSKTVIIDKTLTDFWKVFQHEVFGHGARAREYGYFESTYVIDFPQGGGKIYYGPHSGNRMVSDEEFIMRTIGGVESTTIFANALRNKWVQSGQIPYSEAYLYYSNFIGVSRYIRSIDEDNNTSFHDMFSYYRQMNRHYDYDLEETPFTVEYLKKRALVNYFNPLNYYALWVLLKEYIWSGNETAVLPMIPIGKYDCLPFFYMGVSPFGTEIYVENALRTDQSVINAYVRIGDDFFGKHWGMGINKTNIINNAWLGVDAGLDFWRQPALVLGGEELDERDAGIGGAAKLGLAFKISKGDYPLSIYSTIGYKTTGYLQGEYLKDGVFVRAGLMLLALDNKKE
ncbi:MAG: hypothetical protein MI974_30810 [Chitinophagales bacterium]|nr:hypothetical protein [Chitinophagales bacterium]